jgi:transcriptional regulator with XRE-family HTH domain
MTNQETSGAVDKLIAFIRARIAELGISQNELARRSGLNPGSLANIMVGRVRYSPSIETLIRLAEGLQVPPMQLIALTGDLQYKETAMISPRHAERYGEYLGRLKAAKVPVDKFWKAFMFVASSRERLGDAFDMSDLRGRGVVRLDGGMSSGERMMVELALHVLNPVENPCPNIGEMANVLDDEYWEVVEIALRIHRTGKGPGE